MSYDARFSPSNRRYLGQGDSSSTRRGRATSPRTAATSYGLGWLFVELIGWEGLLLLARRSEQEGLERVPVEWILAAAGPQPLTQENLERAFRHALGESDLTSEQPFTITLRN